jgi:hypothetical protein
MSGRLLEAAPGIKYKAILGTTYGAGLRVSEVASLKVDDIDSARMLIRVEQGKGRKDRNAMLSPQLVALLRLWWKEGKQRSVMLPHGWLFPGRSATDPISTRQINRAIHEAAEAAGIRKRVTTSIAVLGIQATGGGGGQPSGSGGQSTVGAGGVGSGGTLNLTGNTGQGGAAGTLGGGGGGSPMGIAGAPGGSNAGTGAPGNAPGGGGGGTATTSGGQAGGAGGAGLVIIEY